MPPGRSSPLDGPSPEPADVRADPERRELGLHLDVMAYVAHVREALMDLSAPGGERRLKAKFADRTGDAAG